MAVLDAKRPLSQVLGRMYNQTSAASYGSRTSEITELDKEGAQKVYGLPLDSFAFVPV